MVSRADRQKKDGPLINLLRFLGPLSLASRAVRFGKALSAF